MRLQCAPECLTFPSPEMTVREAYAYPPFEQVSSEHTSQMWHATPLSPNLAMWTLTEEDAPNVLEHSANMWHDTLDESVQTVLEHTEPEAKSLNFNELNEWHSINSLEVPVWHATQEDPWGLSTTGLDEAVLEHAADLWHATVSEAADTALEHTLCACHRRSFCLE